MPSFLIFCRHTLKHLRASTINSFLCKHSFLCLLPHYRTFRSYGKSVESSFVLYRPMRYLGFLCKLFAYPHAAHRQNVEMFVSRAIYLPMSMCGFHCILSASTATQYHRPFQLTLQQFIYLMMMICLY